LVVKPWAWVANPAIWVGVFFLARRKPRVAAGAGLLAFVLGLAYLELMVGHSLLSPNSYSVGYFCWVASAMLLTATSFGLRWFGMGRRLTTFSATTVALGVALLVATEHYMVVMAAPPSETTLVDRLFAEDVSVRRSAARKLALDHNPKLIPYFIQAAKDPDDKVRQSVIGALGDIGPGAVVAVPALVGILSGPASAFDKKTDPKRAANSRSEAAAAIGKIGPMAKVAIPALIDGLKDQNVPVRRWSATSLGEMRTEGRSAVPALVQALHDPDAQVRRYAIQSLQKIGIDHDTLPALTPSLHDSDDTVRETAAVLLKAPNKSP
jgi:HEAT repeat protein